VLSLVSCTLSSVFSVPVGSQRRQKGAWGCYQDKNLWMLSGLGTCMLFKKAAGKFTLLPEAYDTASGMLRKTKAKSIA
jgi:hypothetical protein